MNQQSLSSASPVPDTPAGEALASSSHARRKFRHFKDKLAGIGIAVGGLGVIAAVLLIFLYLIYEVMPLFRSALIQDVSEFRLEAPHSDNVLHLAVEERLEVAMRLGDDGEALFFNTSDGALRNRIPLRIPQGQSIVSFALDTDISRIFALGLSNGHVLIAEYDYDVRFGENNERLLTPVIRYPFGEDSFALYDNEPVSRLSVRSNSSELLLAGTNPSGQVRLLRARRETSLLSAFSGASDADWKTELATLTGELPALEQLYLDMDRRWLFAIDASGHLSLVDVRPAFSGGETVIADEVSLAASGGHITEVNFLLGGISLLVGDSDGAVSQWFLVRRDGGGFGLEKVREFDAGGRVLALAPEQRRKNFITANEQGYVGIYNTTAHRQVAYTRLLDNAPRTLAISARGDGLLLEHGDGHFSFWRVSNRHPEVSWEALWQKVWYENYQQPEYIWQSSAANNDFEPKYSLAPLAFGTLKAAFYAMLLAAPLAVCGAIFTGYFMAPKMRRNVKPLIELMEALPTVVLGFLAGLWLAPFLETHLLGIFSLLVLTPVSILLAAFVWTRLPEHIRFRVPEGWEAALLIPVILIVAYLSFLLAAPIELLFFDGDMRSWITHDLGIAYDQRNALVVGFAMGFAVIPTIFSIAEDAVFTVPKQLTYGSLALGATPWQTLSRVVLPTASPGIFSALMIGMGRAVGETMIVLMATGNTPIMDINIFEGMRTLAANIAVEVPESEVDSTHYRILFLAALVLFMFTFVVNTLAEIIRQRLRRKVQHDMINSVKKFFASGTPWIWVNAGAVAISVIMTVGLLLLLAINGLNHFWPKDIMLAHYTQPSDGEEPLRREIIGERVDREQVPAERIIASGIPVSAEKPLYERELIKVGNRELNNSDFTWLLTDYLEDIRYPDNLTAFERREWGNFYGYVLEVRESGTAVASSDPTDPADARAWMALEERIARALAIHEEIDELEKDDIGEVNYALERLRLQRRALELRGEASEEALAEIEAEVAVWESSYEQLQTRLSALYEEVERDSVLMLAMNEEQTEIRISEIVRAYQPNRMHLGGKLFVYAQKLWEFLSDEPREANTEGGIFPAIFGTVTMVLLMSVFVTPFGVVAAVYLREYARQGFITRTIRIAVNNLAGVPSIVYGVFGLGFFIYFLGSEIDQAFYPEALPAPTFGTPGMLWASLTLALLTVPVVIVSTEEGLARIPRSLREGSLALGATKFETLWRVVLPMASPAMMTGLILAVARAAGEVAPLMLVGVVKLAPTLPINGNYPYFHLDQKFMHLGFHIYDVGFQSPNVEAARPLVFATAFLLVVVIALLNQLAVTIRNRLREKYKALDM